MTEVDEDKLAKIRAALKWQQNLSLNELSQTTASSAEELMSAMAVLGSRGLVGFDLDFSAYFHRELPFDLSLVEGMHPRLRAAQKIVGDGELKVISREIDTVKIEVKGSDVKHIVTVDLKERTGRCTCQWYSKYQGARGSCKHILAAKLKLAADELTEEEAEVH